MRHRKWVYVQQPDEYEIRCDKCNGSNIAWSEYEHMIWCYDCQIDTPGNGGIFDGPIPAHATGWQWLHTVRTAGIFDGPIPAHATELLGMSLARLYLKDGIVRYPNTRNHKIVYTKVKPDYMAEWHAIPKPDSDRPAPQPLYADTGA